MGQSRSEAALAHILRQPGGDHVAAALRAGNHDFAMSNINWCETLTRRQRESASIDGEKLARMLPGVSVIALDRALAGLAATFSRLDSSLSLGDRACLALAQSRKATVWTAGRIWARMTTSVPIELLR